MKLTVQTMSVYSVSSLAESLPAFLSLGTAGELSPIATAVLAIGTRVILQELVQLNTRDTDIYMAS